VQILSEKGKAAGFDNWNYDSEKEEINIDHAYSINDEEVTPLSSRTIKTAMVHSAYPQYQRQKNIKFAMPKIRKGTILDYQVTRKVKSDAFLHPFAVGLSRGSAGDAVSLDAGHNSSWNAAPACFWPVENLLRKELFVEVPTNSDMRITLLNNDSNTITMAKTEKDNYNTYHFYNKEPLIARKNESNLPPISEFVPMVLFSKKVEWPNLHKQLLPLYTETAADRKAAESLLTRLKKEKGKITEEIISNFVALEIEGLPVELRDYDVKPKSIVEIIEKRKASRLDAAWLLVNLLKAAKIDATMAFTINSGFSRDIPMEHPALFYLESPIVRIKNEVGKIHYILPSAPYLNYLDSSVVLEGIDVLVVEKKALITEKIPRTKRSHLSTVINTKLSENGSLSVDTYQTIARGIHQSQFRQLRSVNPKKYPLIAQNVASALHPNAVLKTFDFKNIKELSGQVTLDFTLDIPNYCTRAGNLFFMKLLDVSHFMTRDATPAERLNAGIDLGNGDLVTRQAEYEIPAGFSVYYLPSPRKVETQWFTYRAEITHEGNKLLFNEVTQITDPSIPKEQYSLYQNFRKTMADFSEEYIIFEKQK
jgi:hypothetical protein